MFLSLRSTLWALLVGFAATTFTPSVAQARPSARKVKKPIQVFVNAVRYGKNAKALEYVDGPAQGEFLLGDAWAKAKPDQQKKFVSLFHVLFAQLAFPKLKNNLSKIETITYGRPELKGEFTEIQSTLVVLHPMKKQEVKVTYRLRKQKKRYRLVDVTFEGDKSLLTNIRDDQIRPLLSENGWDGLMGFLEKRAQQIKAKQAK